MAPAARSAATAGGDGGGASWTIAYGAAESPPIARASAGASPPRADPCAVRAGRTSASAQSTLALVTRVYVGLGSNIGDREHMLRRALTLLAETPGVEVVAISSFRETEPVGFADQPRFLNAAAAVETDRVPCELLERLLEIERALGRTRVGPRFGPRAIDLDLLLYGDAVLDEPGLRVPHPSLHERRFALEPLAELDPELVVPGRGAVFGLLSALD